MPQDARYERHSANRPSIGGFGGEFDATTRARIRTVLQRLAYGDRSRGTWSEIPDRIDVVRRFDDGASGVLVVGIEVHWETGSAWHVAKIGPPDEIEQEWNAFKEVLQDRPAVLCPPIVVVTRGVLDSGERLEDEAAVYADVRGFAAAEGPVESLEEVARRAVTGSAEDLALAEAVVNRLLNAAAKVFYDGASLRAQRDRMDAKQSFGPDLRILMTTQPSDDTWLPLEIVAAGLRLPEAEVEPPAERELGDHVAILGVNLGHEGHRWTATREEAVIEVGIDPSFSGGAGPLALLHGRVLGTRSRDIWDHARATLTGLRAVEPGVIEYDGVRTSHPFAALRRALAEEGEGIVAGRAHGDPNSRNVLVADGAPYMIDYAGARGSGVPVHRDPAWLELDLLRWAWRGLLTYEQFVWVQRLLHVGDRVATLLPGGDRAAVTETLADLGERHGAGVVRVLRILTHVRRRTQRIGQGLDAEPWWQGYQKELLLAVYRAAKWRERQPELWPVQLAVGAVASEALTEPFVHWPAQDLAAVAVRLLELLPDSAAAAPLLGDLVQALRARYGTALPARLTHAVRAARARVAAAAAAGAERRLRELQDEHDRYMDLAAASPGPGRPDDEPGQSAVDGVLRTDETVVLGPSGSGKTALLQEMEYRLLDLACSAPEQRERSTQVTGRLPVPIPAPLFAGPAERVDGRVDEVLSATYAAPPGSLLRAGAVHVLVDDVHRVSEQEIVAVCEGMREFRRRHPDVPVTVAVRDPERLADLAGPAGWKTVRLLGPSRAQAARYLTHSWRELAVNPAIVAEHVDAALTASATYAIAERSPWVLAMLAAMPPSVSASASVRTHGDVLEAYVSQLLSGLPAAEEAAVRCEERARRPPVTDEPDERHAADDVDRALVHAGLLADHGQDLRFARPDVRDYFAARWLRGVIDGGPARPQKIDHHLWGAWQMLVSLSSTPADVRDGLIRLAAEADPVLAARLLAACPPGLRPRAFAESFIGRQLRRLRDGALGVEGHRQAAEALAATQAAAGHRSLLAVLTDGRAPVDARLSCVQALAGACAGLPGRSRARQLRKRVEASCATLLAAGEGETELIVALLDTVGGLRFDRLAVSAFAFLRSPWPWPVRLAAIRALKSLRVSWPPAIVEEVDRTAKSTLAELEDGDRTTRSDGEFQRHRLELLDAMSPAERLPELLARRTSFRVGTLIGELIEEGGGLTGDPGLGDMAGDDEARVTGARLHGLLRMGEPGAVRVFTELLRSGRTDQAASLAAAVRMLPTASLPAAFDYAGEVTLALAADASADLEGAASLVLGVFHRDPIAGIRLARRAHRVLVRLDRPERFQWPWPTALALCAGTAAELEHMLAAADQDDRDLALDVLADHAFLLTAAPAPGHAHRFGSAACEHVLSGLAVAEGDDAFRFAKAVCALELPSALPDVVRVAEAGRTEPAVRIRAGQGMADVVPAAELVAGVGCLARAGTPAQRREAHDRLSAFDTTALAPSVEAGRLIGLAYLGEWQPLFQGVADGRPRCADAASNVIRHWLPEHGPALEEVARWIRRRTDGPGLGPAAHSALLRLNAQAERLAGSTPL